MSQVITLYRKTFISGPLKGLTVDGAVSHPDRNTALKFSRALQSNKMPHVLAGTGAEWEAGEVEVKALSKLTPAQIVRYGLSYRSILPTGT